jgi:MoaA/NifB/PqqE/SkfB family radical SAM enzyme
MSTLVQIAPAISGPELQQHRIMQLPVLVLFPHNRCNCRCMMCDIWRIRETRQLWPSDLTPHMESIRALGVRWVVLSGGEPLLHEGLGELLSLFRAENIRITLLSTGLLLKSCARLVALFMDDVIVSLDGPSSVHNAIRRVPDAYQRLKEGIDAVRRLHPEMKIHGRCTVQKANHAVLEATLAAAMDAGLDSISFLAADTTSLAFNRPDGWNDARKNSVQLNEAEVETLAVGIERMIMQHSGRFVRESPEKLRRIVGHFRAALGQQEPVAPRCNAPWVSAVIEADGTVRPCFFHPPVGNLCEAPLERILNSKRALEFRASLHMNENPTCRNCVCSLHYSKMNDNPMTKSETT